MKKLTIVLTGLIGFTSIMPFYASEGTISRLSSDEAIMAIWKLNYRDTIALYRAFFPKKNTAEKAEPILNDEATQCIENVQTALQRNKFKNAMVAQILKTFDAATPTQREMIKTALLESRKEYKPDPVTTSKAIATLVLFPFSLISLVSEHRKHVKKIEAKRAGIPVEDTVTV